MQLFCFFNDVIGASGKNTVEVNGIMFAELVYGHQNGQFFMAQAYAVTNFSDQVAT